VGSSTGGAIGQQMALRHPGLVRSLVPVASWARTDEYFRRWFELRMLMASDHTSEDHVDLTMLLLFDPQFRRDNPEVVSRLRVGMLKRVPAVEVTVSRMQMLLSHNVLAELPALTVPALVIGGGRDTICPPYLVRELAGALQNSQLVLAENAGHYVHVEASQFFFDTVSQFIAAHD
jgi:aminoacrylate hydrolase